MNDFPLVSVIIPVYNTEIYLEKCLESVINQTYKNLEIILIDDGSTDNSGKICDEYALNDKRIKVFHKENGGQCTARNLGLDNMNGEYVAFVDSDDWVEENYISLPLEVMKKTNSDIVCFAGASTKGEYYEQAFFQPEIMRETLYSHYGTGHSPCDKLIKVSLFENLRYPIMRACEDCALIYKLLSKTNKVTYCNVWLYHYETRPNSTMTQPFSNIKFQAIYAYEGMYDFYLINYPQYKKDVKPWLLGSIQYCLGETYKRKKNVEYKDEVIKARGIAKKLDYKKLPLKNKISLFFIKHNIYIFSLFYKLTHKN